MQLLVNGETITVSEGDTVAAILEKLGYSGDTFAVACNGDFVPRGTYGETRLNAGDSLDIVAPVVGG